jgi:hypothetical protein
MLNGIFGKKYTEEFLLGRINDRIKAFSNHRFKLPSFQHQNFSLFYHHGHGHTVRKFYLTRR